MGILRPWNKDSVDYRGDYIIIIMNPGPRAEVNPRIRETERESYQNIQNIKEAKQNHQVPTGSAPVKT